jgi:hypothetical protein
VTANSDADPRYGNQAAPPLPPSANAVSFTLADTKSIRFSLQDIKVLCEAKDTHSSATRVISVATTEEVVVANVLFDTRQKRIMALNFSMFRYR